ncbi:ATP synthase complex subunit H-domain-containing protein [Piptocephalis cylindrospora]|uniref:ATP synthase complex subunit H-domain-containing protein n=1 Tax=Piptocephalis cylindrospora TaxID=1907219 RepID=A0A4P9Y7A4_9FUNG|nr:ATP synthase complex subunit H-domain-containing protein [Piptocephalis cylindrospora]|eukprot:RKP14996.1 ATP synthase complex subunit H-domain-containing protein [Piptocephalis cylindrospora]
MSFSLARLAASRSSSALARSAYRTTTQTRTFMAPSFVRNKVRGEPIGAGPSRECAFLTITFSLTFRDTRTWVDLVQELYLKELKGYKPTTEPTKMEQGQVKDFVAPAKPAVPSVDATSLSSDLAAYDVEEDVSASQDEGLALPDEDFESEDADEASAH